MSSCAFRNPFDGTWSYGRPWVQWLGAGRGVDWGRSSSEQRQRKHKHRRVRYSYNHRPSATNASYCWQIAFITNCPGVLRCDPLGFSAFIDIFCSLRWVRAWCPSENLGNSIYFNWVGLMIRWDLSWVVLCESSRWSNLALLCIRRDCCHMVTEHSSVGVKPAVPLSLLWLICVYLSTVFTNKRIQTISIIQVRIEKDLVCLVGINLSIMHPSVRLNKDLCPLIAGSLNLLLSCVSGYYQDEKTGYLQYLESMDLSESSDADNSYSTRSPSGQTIEGLLGPCTVFSRWAHGLLSV